MKLQPVYAEILQLTKDWIAKTGEDKVKTYIEEVRASGDCRNFDVRIANDVVKYGAIYNTIGVNQMCKWYDEYGCHDDHVTTLCIKVMKNLNLL